MSSIVLNMIVKNESHIILETLQIQSHLTTGSFLTLAPQMERKTSS